MSTSTSYVYSAGTPVVDGWKVVLRLGSEPGEAVFYVDPDGVSNPFTAVVVAAAHYADATNSVDYPEVVSVHLLVSPGDFDGQDLWEQPIEWEAV